MIDTKELYKQLRGNIVSIITILIAATALVYNTWRNQRTEANRTTRVAAFEVLKSLGELQVVVNYTYYSGTGAKSDPMVGWGYIALIGDLSEILPEPIPEKTTTLIKTWQSNWSDLKTSEESADKISGQIDSVREAIREQLRLLN